MKLNHSFYLMQKQCCVMLSIITKSIEILSTLPLVLNKPSNIMSYWYHDSIMVAKFREPYPSNE